MKNGPFLQLAYLKDLKIYKSPNINLVKTLRDLTKIFMNKDIFCEFLEDLMKYFNVY